MINRIRGIFRSRCLVSLFLFFVYGCGQGGSFDNARVAHVYDGDTIRLTDGTKVRLIGIDCPETRDNDKLRADARRSGQNLKEIMERGRRAYLFTRGLVSGRRVQLELGQEPQDKYGRTLAYVWIELDRFDPDEGRALPDYFVVESRADAQGKERAFVFLNATIMKAGYARPMIIPPNTRYEKEMRSYYHLARQNRWGLWK